MTWVRFHGELRQGEKRGLPRAARFVYMELSHEARPKRGLIVLPQRMSDVDAVHELLGGNRKEVVDAVRLLASDVDPMIRFEDRDGKRVLVVVNWEKWNPQRDDSRDRVAKHRQNANMRPSDEPEREPDDDGCNALHGATETPSGVLPISVTPCSGVSASARARANLLSSLSDLSRSPERGAGGRFALPDDFVLGDDWRATAEMAGLVDVDLVFRKFRQLAAEKQWSFDVHGWDARWQRFCDEERPRQQTARYRSQKPASGHPGASNGQDHGDLSAHPSRKRLHPLPREPKTGGGAA